MLDKDIQNIVKHLKTRIDYWCLTTLPLARAASPEQLNACLVQAGVANADIACFNAPAEAYANALSRAGKNDRIVVFGSFLTVAGVMGMQK